MSFIHLPSFPYLRIICPCLSKSKGFFTTTPSPLSTRGLFFFSSTVAIFFLISHTCTTSCHSSSSCYALSAAFFPRCLVLPPLLFFPSYFLLSRFFLPSVDFISKDAVNMEVLRCSGAIAAIATCMGTPLSAVMFVLEALPFDIVPLRARTAGFTWWTFSAITGLWCGRSVGLHVPFAGAHELQSWKVSYAPDLIGATFIGAVCAVLAILFHASYSSVYKMLTPMRHRFNVRGYSGISIFIAALLSVLFFFYPLASGTSDTLVHHILSPLHEQHLSTLSPLIFVLFAKLVATVLSLAGGFQGGIIGPCLVVGACASLLCFRWMHIMAPFLLLSPSSSSWRSSFFGLLSSSQDNEAIYKFSWLIDPYSLAACGSAAMIASTTRLPWFAIIFACEVFSAFHGLILVMLAVAISYAITAPILTPTDSTAGVALTISRDGRDEGFVGGVGGWGRAWLSGGDSL